MSSENKTLTPIWIVYADGARLPWKYDGALRKIRVFDRLNSIGTASLVFGMSAPDFDNDDVFSDGTCNEEKVILSCFSVWRREKDESNVLLSLEKPSKSLDFWMTDFSGAYRIKNEVHIWGMTATEQNEIKNKFELMFSDYNKSDVVSADRMINSENIIKVSKCKKMISGNFMWSFACIGGSDFNYSYTACLQNDGTLIIWTNGKTYISDKSLKICNIWGSNGIIAQTEDCKIYVTGYNLFNRLGINNIEEDDFLFLAPLNF